jgi:hypothetical protein
MILKINFLLTIKLLHVIDTHVLVCFYVWFCMLCMYVCYVMVCMVLCFSMFLCIFFNILLHKGC